MYLKIEWSVITLLYGPFMGVQSRFGLWDRVKELNIRDDIPRKASEHVEGVMGSSSFY